MAWNFWVKVRAGFGNTTAEQQQQAQEFDARMSRLEDDLRQLSAFAHSLEPDLPDSIPDDRASDN